MGASGGPAARGGGRAAFAMAIALAAGAIAPAAAGAAPPTWDPVAHPSTSGKTQNFNGVDAAGTDDVWAVGDSYGVVGGALEFRTLAQHWDGADWTAVPTPDVETAPARDLLEDVSAAGPSDVWAVGASGTSISDPSSKPLVEHWNGSRWSIVTLPPTPSGSTLDAVAADAGVVWALGQQYNPESGYPKPLILRRGRGGTVTELPLTATAGCSAAPDRSFYSFVPGGITTGPNGLVYVAGTCAGAGGDRGVLARYRDGRWRSAIDPASLPAPSRLKDASTLPNGSVLAVGAAGGGPLVVHGSGLRFVTESAPNLGSGIGLNSVAAGTPSYAVGSYASGDPFARPAVLRRARDGWRSEPVSSQYGNPFGVAADPAGQAWAVGAGVTDDAGLILKRSAIP